MRNYSCHIRGFLALLSFLTIIPTKIHDVFLAAEYFHLVPIVGLIEGVIVVLPLFIPIPSMMKAVLALLIFYILTGFNHLDGFADFIDALASRRKNEEALKIMKEPWRGTMAIVSTTLLIIITYASLTVLVDVENKWYYIVILAQVLAFESAFILAILSNPPTYQGLGKLFITKAKRPRKIIANIILMLIITSSILLFYSLSLVKILILIVMTTATLLTVLYAYIESHRVLGYSTGDVLGFCLELSRSTNLLIASILLSVG